MSNKADVSQDSRLTLRLPDFTRDFVQLPNSWVRDARLSRRARGLLVELASHRDGFEVSLGELVDSGPEGKDALNAAIRELENIGYLTRIRLATPSGMKAGYEWRIGAPEPVDNAGAENPLSGPLGAENPLRTGAENPRSYKNTKEHSSSSSEGEYRSHAREALDALRSASIYLDARCAHAMAGSGRACGGRVLRDQPRWCEFGHEQQARATA